MAIALATSTNAFFKTMETTSSFRVLCNVVLSGSYTTGGTGESLETILADARVKVPAGAKTRGTPLAATAVSQNGVLYSITSVPAQATLGMKIFTAANTELGSGAYVATYTNDVIRLDLEFEKGGAMARTSN